MWLTAYLWQELVKGVRGANKSPSEWDELMGFVSSAQQVIEDTVGVYRTDFDISFNRTRKASNNGQDKNRNIAYEILSASSARGLGSRPRGPQHRSAQS